jgi:hypothetical protein
VSVEADIRDIRGPKPVAALWVLPVLVLSGLLAAAGLYGTWKWARRGRSRRKTLAELTLERLQRACGFMRPDGGREFAIDVSNVVREYIEARFEVRAAHLTTDEFLRNLGEHTESMLAAHRVLLDDFLQTCDLGKFGGWRLSIPDMTTMFERAREFVMASAETSKLPQAERAGTTPDPSNSAAGETYASLPST